MGPIVMQSSTASCLAVSTTAASESWSCEEEQGEGPKSGSSPKAGGEGMSGAKPGSRMEGAVVRAIGVFSRRMGNTAAHRGRRAPRWDMNAGLPQMRAAMAMKAGNDRDA